MSAEIENELYYIKTKYASMTWIGEVRPTPGKPGWMDLVSDGNVIFRVNKKHVKRSTFKELGKRIQADREFERRQGEL
jgi:hypothetical protein